MSERPTTRINLERYRERLDRVAPASELPVDRAPSTPEALTLLTRLGESIDLMAGGVGAGIRPLFEQVRGHVEALFLAPAAASLDEEAHAAHKARLEELCQTLEGVLYACSLPVR